MFSFPELCRVQGRAEGLSLFCDLVTQPTQRGLQPEDWKGQRPNQQKRPREEASSRWISNEESPHCTGVTPQRPSTPAQPPPHCGSTALRVVTGVGHGFLVVGFFQVVGQVGRSVALSVEVTPKRSKDRGGWSQRLQGQSLKKSSRLGQPKAVGRVKPSGNLYTKSSRPGLSSETGQVKTSGSPVELACLIQRERTSEGFW